MSTNLRKAQKHMQRARELLNQEGQLEFGVPEVPAGPDYWSALPNELQQNILKKAYPESPCKHVCFHAELDRKSKEESLDKCKECNKHAELARNNQIQLKLINTCKRS